MTERNEIKLFKFRRLLAKLGSREGRGTELISLYIPPDKQPGDVTSYLRKEYGTAANIKSKTTRKNVQDALTKVIQKLKLFKTVPKNGLCIFCGMVPVGPPGSERMEIYILTPIKPISSFMYRCDARFLLDPLLELATEREESYGIVVLDTQRATFAVLRGGKRLEVVKSITSGISGKHRAGGQSAARFERLRAMEVLRFFRRISKYVDEIFLRVPDLNGLIVGGPGPTKSEFLKKATYHYSLKEKTLEPVDTGYSDEEGINEAVENSKAVLENVRFMEEKRAVQRFLHEIGRDTGLALYGEDEVRDGLKNGRVKTLLLSEDLSTVHLRIKCSNCGYDEVNVVEDKDVYEYKQSIGAKKCPECSSQSLAIADEKDLMEEFIELAERSNTEIKIISSRSEEGSMLKRSFSGIAALLKRFD
ncbi:MAG: peptide chain release factor aRF-1 [Candidatus Bathyarchaeia archaeon]